ncbi:hypothetical protein EMIT0P201_50259 [Pseudomonas chlororaphis]
MEVIALNRSDRLLNGGLYSLAQIFRKLNILLYMIVSLWS